MRTTISRLKGFPGTIHSPGILKVRQKSTTIPLFFEQKKSMYAVYNSSQWGQYAHHIFISSQKIILS